jgi:hypothetical protein
MFEALVKFICDMLFNSSLWNILKNTTRKCDELANTIIFIIGSRKECDLLKPPDF